MRRQFQFHFAVLLMIGLVACAPGTTPPATSPIAESGVVGGRVEMTIVPGAAVPPVLVSVAGADVTANVSRLGDFVIANVPAGPLELRFTGDGIAAALPLGSIQAGETITLHVRLTPTQAAADAISRIRGTEALVEGVVETPTTPLPPNTIIVGGRTVVLPADGTANGTGALKPGVRVRVTGTVAPNGILARDVTIL